MTTLFRRPGNLVRLSRAGFNGLTYSSTRSADAYIARSRRLARLYATAQPDGNEPKSQPPQKKPKTQPPAGEESKASTPRPSAAQDGGKDGQSEAAESKVKSSESHEEVTELTDKEKEKVDQLMAFLVKSMPKKQGDDLQRVFEEYKKKGIPKEIYELVTKMASDPKSITLASSAQLFRLLSKSVREGNNSFYSQNDPSKEGQKQSENKTEEPKSSSSSSGPDPSKGPDGGPRKVAEFKLDMGTVLSAAFVLYLIYRSVSPGENARDITWQEFQSQLLEKGLVEKLMVVNRSRVRVILRSEVVGGDNQGPSMSRYYFSIGSVEAFERKLDEIQTQLDIPSSQRIPVAYVDEVPWFGTILSFGPTLLLIGAIYWFSRRASSGAGGSSGLFGIGKSRAKRFNHESDIKVKFKDVAGMDEAKQEIMEFVSFLKSPGQYQRLGAKIPRGAILSGPPGTGKTLLAKATAGESQVPFFSVSGSEFVEMFVGVGPSRVRDLFATARKNTPCIIFIDEIDAIGKSRAKSNFGGGNDERESTLNQILTEMDGFNTSEQVCVLAGTNRPDVLDKALMRPGRFDRHIAIDRPTMTGRQQIFKVHLGKVVFSDDIEQLTGRLSALTPGFSGADIANCVNEAALIAARSNANSVEMHHFESAIERVTAGLERKSLVLNKDEKKTVAYHEAGHAICGWYFKYADPLLKVSIIPRGQGALGYAQYLPAGDTYLMNVNQLMDRMAMTLGGRVSEELHFDTVTSGASDDFNKVTRMATAMVTKWGMSQKIGYLYFEEDQQQLHKPFSESTAQAIDAEVRRIVDEAYKQCKNLLVEKKREVGLVAEELLKKEMLVREDMIRLLGKRPFEDNKEFEKYFSGNAGKSAPPPPAGEQPGTPPEMPAPA